MKSAALASDALRYIAAGAMNTLATTAVYFAALLVLAPAAAYALAWLVGLAIVVKFYPEKVFVGGRSSARDRLMLAGFTVANFLLGLALLSVLTGRGIGPAPAFLCVLAVTTATGLLGSRMLLRRRGAS